MFLKYLGLRTNKRPKPLIHVTIKPFFLLSHVMIKIIYPAQKPMLKTEKGVEFIFCIIRKKWLVITPEEWVRQNFLNYLVQTLHYPAVLIAVEKQLLVGEMKKRFDIIVYKDSTPFMIIECKEMNVKLTENTMRQVLRYNSNVQAKYVVVTNGSYCAGFAKKENGFEEIDVLPGKDDSS